MLHFWWIASRFNRDVSTIFQHHSMGNITRDWGSRDYRRHHQTAGESVDREDQRANRLWPDTSWSRVMRIAVLIYVEQRHIEGSKSSEWCEPTIISNHCYHLPSSSSLAPCIAIDAGISRSNAIRKQTTSHSICSLSTRVRYTHAVAAAASGSNRHSAAVRCIVIVLVHDASLSCQHRRKLLASHLQFLQQLLEIKRFDWYC